MKLIKFIRLKDTNGDGKSIIPTGAVYINPEFVCSVSRYEFGNDKLSAYIVQTDGKKYLVRGTVDEVAERITGKNKMPVFESLFLERL